MNLLVQKLEFGESPGFTLWYPTEKLNFLFMQAEAKFPSVIRHLVSGQIAANNICDMIHAYPPAN